VFDPLLGLGRWATVLLADGNIGIGGIPSRLLHGCAQLLAPGGRLLIEAEPGNVDDQMTARLEHPDGRHGPLFPWARMGAFPCRAPPQMLACTSWGNGVTATAPSSARRHPSSACHSKETSDPVPSQPRALRIKLRALPNGRGLLPPAHGDLAGGRQPIRRIGCRYGDVRETGHIG
jgi:hypothetical protein